VLTRTSAAELSYLAGCTTTERLSFLCDTRAAHKRLYQELAPSHCPECAGTYRGTPGTALVGRPVQATRISDGKTALFVDAAKVDANLQLLGNGLFVPNLSGPLTETAALTLATKAFVLFGRIHPYMDGNGHIQRLMFAAIISECPTLVLSPAWTVHPRPYAEDFAISLEENDEQRRSARVYAHLKGYVTPR
jgi:fido (protein-threonine AMPylation protein)